MGRSALARLALALVMATTAGGAIGCGAPGPTPIADGCTAGPDGIVKALAKAPGAVVLEDGSALSQCVADGLDDGELQTVGIAFSAAAEQLRATARTDARTALQLGYLVGVTQKGAKRTAGVMAELVRRIEVTAGRTEEQATPEAARAIERGIAAGASGG